MAIDQLVEEARKQMVPALWDYSAGGSITEKTLRANREALDHIRLRPRVLRDVAEISTKSAVFGKTISVPVLLAPVGSVALFDSGGASSVASAAAASGVVAGIGILSSPTIEEVAAANPEAQLFLQIYIRGNRDWIKQLVSRAQNSGYAAICLTVDSPVEAIRVRDLRNSYSARSLMGPPPNLLGMPMDRTMQAQVSWEDVAWLRSQATLPLILKGIMTPEDAELAIEHGVDTVYISNHGGRTIDGAAGSTEVLAEVVDAVSGRAEVIVDGGFIHGSDVVKALALGAQAVLIGKLQCWALAWGGVQGLTKAIDLLHAEIVNTMAFLGVTSIDDLDSRYIIT